MEKQDGRSVYGLALTACGLMAADVPAAAQAAPSFRANVCDISRYGARGMRVFEDTAAIQRAIDDRHAIGGGTVTVPRGEYLIGGDLPHIEHSPRPCSELVGVADERPYSPLPQFIKVTGIKSAQALPHGASALHSVSAR